MNPSESDPEIPGAILGDDALLVRDKKARQWAMFCHVSGLTLFLGIPFGNILAPLVLWLLKKDVHPFVDDAGKESLNFQISVTLYSLGAIALTFILIGFPILILLAIADIVYVIRATLQADKGRSFQYPFTIRFVK
jgi:uncharacterized protein